MTRRKAITQVVSKRNYNLDDRDTIITLLLKRHCNFEEATDYLLSAVPERLKDDMLGELASWETRRKREP
jgi:hypothetical protein